MNGVAAFCHIVAGGFDAGRSVRTNDVKLGNSTLLNKSGKRLAGQGVALYLRKDMIGYDVQLRHQLCTTGAGLEGSRSRRKVVVLNVNDPKSLLLCPVDRFIDFCNDLLVVFRNVILQVDHDQCAVFHLVFLHKFRVPLYGGVSIRESGIFQASLLMAEA